MPTIARDRSFVRFQHAGTPATALESATVSLWASEALSVLRTRPGGPMAKPFPTGGAERARVGVVILVVLGAACKIVTRSMSCASPTLDGRFGRPGGRDDA